MMVKDEHAGRRVKCPACAGVIAVTAPSQPAPSQPAPPVKQPDPPPRNAPPRQAPVQKASPQNAPPRKAPAADERPRDERSRDERSRSERSRGDRSRDDRPRGERSRSERLRSERPRDTPKSDGLSLAEFLIYPPLFLILPGACVIVSSVLYYVWRGSQPRKASQINWIGFIVFFAQIGLGGLWSFSHRGGGNEPIPAAESFFALLRDGRIDAAYDSTSSAMRRQQSREAFVDVIKQYGRVESFSLPRELANHGNNETKFDGSMGTAMGPVSFTVFLRREFGNWLVDGVTFKSVNAPPANHNDPPPDPVTAEYRRIVLETLLDLNRGLRANDLKPFYEKLSAPLRKGISLQQVATRLKNDINTDFGFIENVTPVFDPPAAVNDKGVLVLFGYYPSAPAQVWFKLKYIRDPMDWKLDSFVLDLVPEKDVPAKRAELAYQRIATESLLELNQAIKAKDFAAFHEKLSSSMKSKFTAQKLATTFKMYTDNEIDFGLISEYDPKFDPPAVVNDKGTLLLIGYYATKPEEMHFEMAYVRDPIDWKLTSIFVEFISKEELATRRAEAEYRRLATESLLDLNHAFKTRDFTAFHEKLSAAMKKERTAKQLAMVFKTFVENNVDISGIKNVVPKFDPAVAVNDKGVLLLSGHFPTRPLLVQFDLQYVRDPKEWKLNSVEFGMVSEKTLAAQRAEAEYQRLAMEALLEFNRAVKAKDFTAFHEKLSTPMKKQFTPQRLATTFKEYVDKKIDIGPIKNFTPKFDRPPATDDKGVLRMAGYYPTEPLQVRFELGFIRDQDVWKLSAISVNLGKE
jgi:hypothetical protein